MTTGIDRIRLRLANTDWCHATNAARDPLRRRDVERLLTIAEAAQELIRDGVDDRNFSALEQALAGLDTE